MPWLWQNYDGVPPGGSTGFIADLKAATTLYAVERVNVAKGMGIILEGTHIENPAACATLFAPASAWSGQVSSELRDIFFNYDPSGITNAG
jgi:hypothetical protein